jgi:hypothetical protein
MGRQPAPTKNYLVEAFINSAGFTAGGIGIYVDEYNAQGDWISGGILQEYSAANAPNVRTARLAYKPKSAAVAKASIQFYTTAGTKGTAYVDHVSLSVR